MKLDRKKMYKSKTKLKLIFNRCFCLNFSSTSLNKCIDRTYIELLNRNKCSPCLFMRQSWNFPLSVCRYEKACWLSLTDYSALRVQEELDRRYGQDSSRVPLAEKRDISWHKMQFYYFGFLLLLLWKCCSKHTL